MKNLVLSDHTGDMVARAAGERRKRYEEDYANHKRKNILVRGLLTLLGAGPRMSSPNNSEIIWRSGHAGEVKIFAVLGSRLNDDWTLISGYRNQSGEIDGILVGPGGVCALEMKSINGMVYVDGDVWKRDKYDNYGNLVERGLPIKDGGGRSPSAQLNQAATRLEKFLSQRARVSRVLRAVVLTHDKSVIGRVSGQTVDWVITAQELNNPEGLFSRSSTYFDPPKREQVTGLIRRDHEFHKNRSVRRRSKHAAR